jgi:hypothetical protein
MCELFCMNSSGPVTRGFTSLNWRKQSLAPKLCHYGAQPPGNARAGITSSPG